MISQKNMAKKKSVFTEQQQQYQEVLRKSTINMENIENEISQLERPLIDVYDKSVDANATNLQELVSHDEYGFM